MNIFSQVFKYLAISMLFTLIGVVVGNIFIPSSVAYLIGSLSWVVVLILLILALFSRKGVIPRRFSMNFVYLYTFIQGIIIYPLLNYYIYDLGINVVITVLISTIIIFVGLAIYAKNNKSNIANYGSVLTIILFGILISTLMNIFFKSDTLSLILSGLSILLFSIYIIYDINMIKRDLLYLNIEDKNDLSIYVLNLYIDFINIFLDLLRLISKLRD